MSCVAFDDHVSYFNLFKKKIVQATEINILCFCTAEQEKSW